MEEPHRQLIFRIDIDEAVPGQEIELLRQAIDDAVDNWCCGDVPAETPNEEAPHRTTSYSSVIAHIDPN